MPLLETDVNEKAKRLTPKGDTLRELFLKSGNLCAYPGCGALMMDVDGVFIGQLCHIEAAEDGGERYNAAMSNEDRRGPANLMLMCYPHHQVTNDVGKFPVAKLRKMKRDHETRFSRPDRAILERLTDWTEADEPSKVANLNRMNTVLGWGHSDTELSEAVTELNAYIEKLRNVPVELRRFTGAVAKRAVKMENSRVVRSDMFGTRVLVSDLQGAFKLGAGAIANRANQLDGYGIGDIDHMDTDLGDKPAVRLRQMKSGWPFWEDLVHFCNLAAEPLEAFTDDLDFQRLDD